MANRTLYFFLAPTWDLPPPPSGPIQLGNVITSLKAPERPLCKAPKPVSEIFSSSQKKVTFSKEKLRDGRFGIFGRFLAMVLGLGVDVTAGWESKYVFISFLSLIDRIVFPIARIHMWANGPFVYSDVSRFIFEALETTQFCPDDSYLQACVAAEPVQRYLSKSRYRKPIYIITGLKTVSGAKVESLRTRVVDGGISPEVDATVWSGVPVGGGIEAGGQVGNRGAVAWEAASDFVFAFRVQKIMVEKRTGAVSSEDYKKGALLDAAIEKRNETEFNILEEEIDDQVEGFLKEQLTDDDGLMVCAVPTFVTGPDGNVA
ncbi:hypothetical protein NUW58_g4378 [Xylaria curta]|uniref:Uncharacterized protein n=2 Tax=Xylaria curta TaxID=42375 RepID=A0ACC1P7J0_9PEZI|nr:hypothetical protein NUW58_g4542 [Xylaria curta]KAJ2987668.1 hypothetical protein NUW58_g4378 [Xylaria curta]